MVKARAILTTCAALLMASAAHAATFQGIGFIDTSIANPLSQSMGVSSDGSVVYGASNAPNTTTGAGINHRAARWTSSGIVDLGYWPDRTGSNHIPTPDANNPRYIRSIAFGSSSDGSAAAVEVQISSSELPATGTWSSPERSGTRVGVYTTANGMQDIIGYVSSTTPGNVEGVDYFAQMFSGGISRDGNSLAGWAVSAGSSNQAWKWTRTSPTSGTLTALGHISDTAGNQQSFARAISGDGTVVGGSSDGVSATDTRRRAVLWTSGGIVTLGQMNTAGTVTEVRGLNTDGSVAVGFGASSTSGTAGSQQEAFRWSALDGFEQLGYLNNSFTRSEATAVSGDGSIVVGRSATIALGTLEAFIWDETNGMRKLRDVLVNDFGLGTELAGWTLSQATDISPDGKYIVGWGTNPNGRTEGYIAAIPEPASLSLFALGGALLLRRTRRQ